MALKAKIASAGPIQHDVLIVLSRLGRCLAFVAITGILWNLSSGMDCNSL
jgi:hypothetical protein